MIAPLKEIYITNPFGKKGYSPFGFHPAVDLRAKIGTPLYAIADGIVKVAKTGGNGLYGKYIILEIGKVKKQCPLFSHLSKFNCSVGQTVHEGDIIGYTGNTGLCIGSHLHFELHDCPYSEFWKGKVKSWYPHLIDPEIWLKSLEKGEEMTDFEKWVNNGPTKNVTRQDLLNWFNNNIVSEPTVEIPKYEKYVSSSGYVIHYLSGPIKDFGVKVFDKGKSNRAITDEYCTNGSFFMPQADKTYVSTSILYANNTMYHQAADHYWDKNKPQSVMTFYNDGTLTMDRKNSLWESTDNIKTAIGGLGLINKLDSNFTYSPDAEGFSGKFADVLYNRPKTVLGWRKEEPDKLYIMVFEKSTTTRMIQALLYKEFAFTYVLQLDGGGSTFMKTTDYVFSGDGRLIHNIVGFNLK